LETMAVIQDSSAAKAPQRDTSEISRQVLGFVSRISAFPVEALKTSQTLAGEVGFDSLMTVELDSDIQKTWPGIGGLPRTLLGPQTTIQDVIDHVASALSGPRAAPAAPLLARAAEAAGPIGAVLHLAGLEQGPSLEGGSWDALLWSQRLARAHSGSFVVATAQDGKLGTESGTLLGAALTAHAKALARERADALVKAIDLDAKDAAEAMADAVLAELRSGNAAPEVGVRSGVRCEPDFAPAASGDPVPLGPGDVVLVTGGG